MTPAASCPLSTLCQTKPQLTSITVHHAHQLICGLQTPSSNRTWGKFVLLSLSWPQASSSAFRLPVHNPNTSTHPSPFVFQSFQGHIPPILTLYQGETASKSIPQISVLYTSPLTSSSNPFSMASSCHISMSSVPLGVSQTLLHTFESSSFLVVHL